MKSLFKRKRYRGEMLPRPLYKKIEDTSKIKNSFLCRLPIKREKGVRFGSDYSKLLPSSQFAKGLSVTLLGVFRHPDANIRVLGDFNDPHHSEWTEGEPSIYPPEFIYREKSHFVAVKISDVESVPPADMTVAYAQDGESREKAYFKVVHRPTKCNFWHFEIQVWNINKEGKHHYLKDNKKLKELQAERLLQKTAKKMKRHLEDKLVHSSKVKPSYLSKNIYQHK